jgi:hypothetical protein
MPSKKKQLMLMKKFQPSKHVLRQAAPSSEDEIVIDFADPFCFDRSIATISQQCTIAHFLCRGRDAPTHFEWLFLAHSILSNTWRA